ncbi:MAG: oligosaccharide flippase family protein [Elusimicrobiota bacterium]
MGDSLDKAQVVILSSIEWEASWQRHQVFASQWAADGHEVFFVENTGFRDVNLGDLRRLSRKLLRLAAPKPARRHGPPPAGLKILNPLVLPPTKAPFRRLNSLLLIPRLAEQLKALGLRPGALAVAYLPTTTTLELLDLLQPRLTLYDCVDNFYGLPSPPEGLARTEAALLKRSGLVLTTSKTLYDEKSRAHANVLEIHHGVSPEFFLDESAGRYHKLCYFGTLWRAIDYAPLGALAQAGYEVSLLGPVKEPPPPLPRGVIFKDPISYTRLPKALSDSDVLLLPYVKDEYNRGVIPAKIYECLATGKPILASPLPSLEAFRDLLYIVDEPADWVKAARGLEKSESAAKRQARVELAGRHTHAQVFARLRQRVLPAWAGAGPLAPIPEGQSLKAFARGFSWIGLLYGCAKVSTLATQVAAGRWLGPSAYGKANVVIAAAAYLQILPMIGFPLAISKFVSAEADEEERGRIISTTLTCFALWAAAWLLVLLASHAALAGALGLDRRLFDVSLVFAFMTAFYIVVSSPLLGLRRFDQRGFAETIYGLSAPILLAVFVIKGWTGYGAIIAAFCLALAAGSAYSLGALRKHLRPAFDARVVRLVGRYAALATLNLLSLACILGPARLILHRSNSPIEVGIFSAYFTSTAQISLALLYMLTAVLVPLASSAQGQLETWRAFKRGSIPGWLAAWALFIATASLAMKLFGRQYPFHWEWVLLFSAAASLILLEGLAACLYAARDFRGLCISVTGSLLAGLGNIALGLYCIPRWGITGAAAALVGAQLLALAVYATAGLVEEAKPLPR